MKRRGFTLVEIIVATGIFTVVVTIAVGALVSLNNTSREARAMRIVVDNANSAMDAISRTARMGTLFDCGCDGGSRNCPVSSGANPLISAKNCVEFYGPVGTGTIQKLQFRANNGSSSMERSVAGGAWQRMTAPEVEVTGVYFNVNGADPDQDQPMLTILMTGIAHVSHTARNFSIQTTVSPRTPNSGLVATST